MLRRASVIGLLAAIVALGGCATPATSTLSAGRKADIRRYVEAGGYDRDITVVAAQATGWLEERAARRGPGEKLAVVMDLDETLLRNWPAIRANDIEYVPAAWAAWVHAADAPPIQPVRDVYLRAQRLGMDILLLTGRTERERADTETNLRRIGCDHWAALIFRPADFPGTTEAFKTAERRRLSAAGHVIVANIGDQASDLAGGFAERTFKLPNPFYVTK